MSNRDRVIDYYRRGSDCRWVACLAASRIVGTWAEGETRALARDLSLSVSQVENLARAGLTYRQLRRFGVGCEVRKRLTPGHWAAMGDLMRKYDLTPYDAASTLALAADEGYSITALRAYVARSEGDEVSWSWRFQEMMRKVETLSKDDRTPGLVRATLSLLRELERLGLDFEDL